jgi:casein kinase 1
MVRQGSRQQGRQVPQALIPGSGTPGQATPLSAAAHIDVPIGSSNRRTSQPTTQQHPYANAGYDSYGRGDNADEYSATQAQYGRASPMVSSVGAAPPAVSNVRAISGEHGIANGGDYHGQATEERPKNTLWQILTCRCG